eukprot:jgi/Mesvir1/25617/Mv01843-RA.1
MATVQSLWHCQFQGTPLQTTAAYCTPSAAFERRKLPSRPKRVSCPLNKAASACLSTEAGSPPWQLTWLGNTVVPAGYRRFGNTRMSAGKNLEGSKSGELYLGIDFGTSGARATVVDEKAAIVEDVRVSYMDGAPSNWAHAWSTALKELLAEITPESRAQLAGIAIDGTSSTTMIVDGESGKPLAAPVLYNEVCKDALPEVSDLAPPHHTVSTASSTLCKLVSWYRSVGQKLEPAAWSAPSAPRMLHQADWLGFQLHGVMGVTDYNNALKVGYDPATESYPSWLSDQPYAHMLPRVVAPGTAIGPVTPHITSAYRIPATCVVYAGTTDSIAAFLAAGVSAPGEAVSSLGSTLAVKSVSLTRVDDARYGVYSHRMADAWLVGGASNTGGAVLRKLFTDDRLRELSSRIDPSRPSPLDYYPLLQPGERFPVCDPELQPRLQPRPADDAGFLHGIFESIARIETQAYQLLAKLGATPVTAVYTAGGGAQNPIWGAIRQRVLGVPVFPSRVTEASYGAALLALRGHNSRSPLGP